MKARIQAREAVLLYRLEGTEKESGIRAVASSLGMQCVTVTPEMLGWTVGRCADLEGFAPEPPPEQVQSFPEEAMVMLLSRERLDELLTALRKAGVKPVSLKAMVTEHNKAWTMTQLLQELTRERQQIL